jgi:pimeloyl-ACP methyl ester carboxylesterase
MTSDLLSWWADHPQFSGGRDDDDATGKGESEGEPRGRIHPSEQIEDFRNAATFQAVVPHAAGAEMVKALAQDRIARYKTGEVNYLPVVAADNNAVLNTSDSYEWFTTTHQKRAPRWENRVTVESVEKFIEYSPAAYLARVSPTPFLMMVAESDVLTPADVAIAAFSRMHEPKKLVILPGGHFDAYVAGFAQSSENAIAWFRQWLM